MMHFPHTQGVNISSHFSVTGKISLLLENYQALLWGVFQMGKFLREKATLLFTVTYQAMQDCNL